MKLVFPGTGGPRPDPRRMRPAALVEADARRDFAGTVVVGEDLLGIEV